MIIGIGTDIIDTRRIKKTITNFGNNFKKSPKTAVTLFVK